MKESIKKRESENERIRRTLVEYFGPEVQLDFVRGVPIQKIRDWLEKQKGSNDMAFHEGYTLGFEDGFQVGREQKPAEWSEEDELNIGWLIAYLKGESSGEYYDEMMRESLADWLKSLRPRLSPKSDAEPIDPFDTIRLFTDINLVQELRRRGYEVTCKKTIEL